MNHSAQFAATARLNAQWEHIWELSLDGIWDEAIELEQGVTGRVQPIDPERYYATDASGQAILVDSLDRGHGYQKTRSVHSLQEVNDTEDYAADYLDSLTELWLLAHDTRKVLAEGRS